MISDDELHLSDLPPDDADWTSLSSFALTLNGYCDDADRWWKEHGANVRLSFEGGVANLESLALRELRICLFHEQRMQRFRALNIDTTYMRALVHAIRAHLSGAPAS